MFFAGDSASSAVVVIIWCCEGKCGASTTGKQDACAAAGEFCLLLVNVLLGNTECSFVGDTGCFSVVVKCGVVKENSMLHVSKT